MTVFVPSRPSRCGELLTVPLHPSYRHRVVVACVDEQGHDPSNAHRSGTDPVLRWRPNAQDPNVTDVWTEPWRDWAGRTVTEREAAGLVT